MASAGDTERAALYVRTPNMIDLTACRDELLAWLAAHAHWPIAGRIDGPAGLIAEMRGHLAAGDNSYAIVAEDIGALRFTVPPQITAVAINGSRSASFARTDVPATLTLTVAPPTAADER